MVALQQKQPVALPISEMGVTMKMKMLVAMEGTSDSRQPGQVVEVKNGEAAQLVRKNFAECVDDKDKSAVSKAVKSLRELEAKKAKRSPGELETAAAR